MVFQCRISAVRVKTWAGLWLMCLAGCGGGVTVIRSGDVVEPGQGIILLAVSLSGTPAPVHITVGCERLIGSSALARELVFARRDDAGPGEPRLNELLAVAVPAGTVDVALVRIGEFYEFAGGQLEHRLDVTPGMSYYLGTVSIDYGQGESVDVYDPEEQEVAFGTRFPALTQTTGRRRFLVTQIRIVNDESSARREAAERFGLHAEQLVNRSAAWERTLSGGLLGSRRSRPVEAVQP